MNLFKKVCCLLTATALAASAAYIPSNLSANAETKSIESSYDWGTVNIGGGGFVSGIVTGKSAMYARTDVGGAYRYNFETDEWEQMLEFLNEDDRGLLSISGIAIDPTDDDTIYILAGCAYFSDARTVIFKSTDGGDTFTQSDVTSMIQCHANGDGRECGEPIAVDPDNPDIIYAGGDVTAGDSALIKSTDGGATWNCVKGYDDLGMYTNQINWPTWDDHPVRAVESGAYNTQNGVATINIVDGKVYVGTSLTGSANVHVADVDKDEFTVLSADLPTANYPTRINYDNNGNLLITYIGALAFGGSSGGAYKYNIASGTVKDISPVANTGYGEVYADPSDPNKLVATTCGLWYSQMWQEWSDEQGPAWGDRFFKSEDGGETWTSMTPGNSISYGGDLEAAYLQDGGYSWIQNKAIHWVGSMVIDPTNPDRVFVTSGNGVFACDNVWDACPQFYFHPNGIEEVVALDFVSTADGHNYSAIGDYDGFEHFEDGSMEQYQPNIGSTCAIAVCPSNTSVMARFPENDGSSYYTTDGGATWTEMGTSKSGGKAAITQLEDGTYRIFKSNSSDCSFSYSDDFGTTWKSVSGIASAYGSKPTYFLVDPNKPNVVYAYATYYNSSWFYSKSEAEYSDAHYTLYTSTDYGTTWSSTDIAMYDQCDSAGRIAYLEDDSIILAAGWYGLYNVTNGGKTVTSKNVYYAKTVGYGAPEKEGDVNTLYIYGKPTENDPEGIYRSQDGGDTWVLINENNLYGGTGNGNFLVGDMTQFGTVYMSTVGCGIVKGVIGDASSEETTASTTKETKPTTEATTAEVTTEATTEVPTTVETTTETPSEITTEDITESSEPSEDTSVEVTEDTTKSEISEPDPDALYGDTNCDGKVEVGDVVLLNKSIVKAATLSTQGEINADAKFDSVIDSNDAVTILKFLVMSYDSLPIIAE
jgi:hypothetical protein